MVNRYYWQLEHSYLFSFRYCVNLLSSLLLQRLVS
jgi:hypothetical protein